MQSFGYVCDMQLRQWKNWHYKKKKQKFSKIFVVSPLPY